MWWCQTTRRYEALDSRTVDIRMCPVRVRLRYRHAMDDTRYRHTINRLLVLPSPHEETNIWGPVHLLARSSAK